MSRKRGGGGARPKRAAGARRAPARSRAAVASAPMPRVRTAAHSTGLVTRPKAIMEAMTADSGTPSAEQGTERAASGGTGMKGVLMTLRRRPRLLVAAPLLLALLVLLPTLLNTSQSHAGAERGRPTPAPSPTATPLPSPTAMPGYRPFIDSADGFVIQHPLAWTCSASNPGVDCIDSPDEQKYRVQVQLPGDWTLAHTGSDPNDASVWVDYALSAFADVPGRTYQRVADSSPQGNFGGATWRGGAAIIGIAPSGSATPTPGQPEVRIRVQVYATVHEDRPYIIALYAAADQFSSGASTYFQPMLASFAFLPANQ